MKTIEEKAKEISQRPFIENQSLSMQMELTKELKGRYDGFKQGVEFAQRWISVDEEPIPKDGKEHLTKNDRQGGVLSLISWNKFNNHYQFKGKYIFEQNAGTHWRKIELL